jgi:hypothetical protein
MKGKWAKGMMACIGVLAASAQAGASPLFPGEAVVPDASRVTGAFVTSVSGTFADGLGRISGTYMESVYRESTGSLSFVYQLANTGPDPLERMTGSAYGGFTTDVSFVAGSGSRDPLFADRTSTPGDAVGFHYTDGDNILPGERSDLLIVRTDATFFGGGTITFQDGGVAEVAGLAPAPAPEPASLTLALVGLPGVGLYLWRRRRTRRA